MSAGPCGAWLDGGYDRDQVEACPHHPDHRWRIYRVGDLCPNSFGDGPREQERANERMVLCESCWVPRCGHSNEENPCVLPRHHEELHLHTDGSTESATSWPGTEKAGAPPALRGKLLGTAPSSHGEET
jgi:hypothetical protein